MQLEYALAVNPRGHLTLACLAHLCTEEARGRRCAMVSIAPSAPPPPMDSGRAGSKPHLIRKGENRA
jgi:hypothetical protein